MTRRFPFPPQNAGPSAPPPTNWCWSWRSSRAALTTSPSSLMQVRGGQAGAWPGVGIVLCNTSSWHSDVPVCGSAFEASSLAGLLVCQLNKTACPSATGLTDNSTSNGNATTSSPAPARRLLKAANAQQVGSKGGGSEKSSKWETGGCEGRPRGPKHPRA